jgi:hypothetical protein
MNRLLELPWPAVIFLCLTLGLAPYAPPHLFEKLGLLARGQLRRPLDWFDLLLHAAPWLLALAKALSALRRP